MTACAPLLEYAIERVRPLLADESKSTKERIRILWAAAKRARDLASSDVVHDAFMRLSVEVRLIDEAGRWTGTDVRESVRRFGTEDVAHVVNWAMRGWNPFEKGPLT
jgi:hypothetical protein